MIRGLKIKKNLNNQINSRKVIRNLHLNKTNSYSNISNQINKKDLYIQDSTDASLILNTKNRAKATADLNWWTPTNSTAAAFCTTHSFGSQLPCSAFFSGAEMNWENGAAAQCTISATDWAARRTANRSERSLRSCSPHFASWLRSVSGT